MPLPRRRFARLRAFLRGPEPSAEPPPTPAEADTPAVAEVEPPLTVVAETPADERPGSATEAALAAALDSLGQAHHRPYSRA